MSPDVGSAGLTLYLGWGAKLRDVSGALDVMTGRCLLGVLPGEIDVHCIVACMSWRSLVRTLGADKVSA